MFVLRWFWRDIAWRSCRAIRPVLIPTALGTMITVLAVAHDMSTATKAHHQNEEPCEKKEIQ